MRLTDAEPLTALAMAETRLPGQLMLSFVLSFFQLTYSWLDLGLTLKSSRHPFLTYTLYVLQYQYIMRVLLVLELKAALY